MVTVGNRTFQNIEQWQVDYIVANKDKMLKEIGSELGINERRVGEVLKHLGISRERHNINRVMPNSSEVLEKLKNPYLSHAEIAKEYGVTPEAVGKRRKAMEVKVRRKNYDTLIEQDVENILKELDLVYSKQTRIDKWSIDFYLGRKYCIDVHGEWAHSKEEVKERDARKATYMNENEYKYLVIHESELEDIDNVVEKIKQFTQGFPSQ